MFVIFIIQVRNNSIHYFYIIGYNNIILPWNMQIKTTRLILWDLLLIIGKQWVVTIMSKKRLWLFSNKWYKTIFPNSTQILLHICGHFSWDSVRIFDCRCQLSNGVPCNVNLLWKSLVIPGPNSYHLINIYFQKLKIKIPISFMTEINYLQQHWNIPLLTPTYFLL